MVVKLFKRLFCSPINNVDIHISISTHNTLHTYQEIKRIVVFVESSK